MQRDPAKRYQHARDMVTALCETPEYKRGWQGDDSAAMPPRPPTPRRRPQDATRAEGPASRARARKRRQPDGGVGVRRRRSSDRQAAVAAVAYSPLGDYLRPRESGRAAARV